MHRLKKHQYLTALMEQAQKALITKDMLIGEAVSQHPEVADVFLSYGLHCVGCHVNAYESIEQGSLGHGMSTEEVDEMIAEANRYLTELEKPKGPFSVTPKAYTKIKQLASEEGKATWGLRVEVQAGGCSGYKYNLEFEEKPRENDTILEEEFKIFIDKESEQMLQGASLDWIEGLNGAGFKINNPNAKSSCGCGKSFS